jgi:hypothetical protein
MTRSDFQMSRRVFLKWAGVQLVALACHRTLGRMSRWQTVQAATQSGGYGSGAYGKDVYVGHRYVFIPLIQREGQ